MRAAIRLQLTTAPNIPARPGRTDVGRSEGVAHQFAVLRHGLVNWTNIAAAQQHYVSAHLCSPLITGTSAADLHRASDNHELTTSEHAGQLPNVLVRFKSTDQLRCALDHFFGRMRPRQPQAGGIFLDQILPIIGAPGLPGTLSPVQLKVFPDLSLSSIRPGDTFRSSSAARRKPVRLCAISRTLGFRMAPSVKSAGTTVPLARASAILNGMLNLASAAVCGLQRSATGSHSSIRPGPA